MSETSMAILLGIIGFTSGSAILGLYYALTLLNKLQSLQILTSRRVHQLETRLSDFEEGFQHMANVTLKEFEKKEGE